MSHVTIDGRQFDLDGLSDEARQQAANIQVIDQEMARLKTQMLIYQTARNAFAVALQQALPKE
ncbi:DUF6447 family protein [Rhodopseudomonas palustris]|uniref:DUF6447 family protein n=1 Tax=Rhodopseudomonas palustris TaxID=1076 RepID=UPI000D1B3E3C|nr:DUF6447 family protein [Rhodopseudomonas palustris]AVT82967.1 hypothetical protein RPYSC3_41070 [Rhodopseudomonas palustris]